MEPPNHDRPKQSTGDAHAFPKPAWWLAAVIAAFLGALACLLLSPFVEFKPLSEIDLWNSLRGEPKSVEHTTVSRNAIAPKAIASTPLPEATHLPADFGVERSTERHKVKDDPSMTPRAERRATPQRVRQAKEIESQLDSKQQDGAGTNELPTTSQVSRTSRSTPDDCGDAPICRFPVKTRIQMARAAGQKSDEARQPYVDIPGW